MAYEIVLGRSAADKERFGLAGSVLIGKQYVKMGASTSLSQEVFLDVNKAHVVFVAGKRGSGKCLSGDTLITLKDGRQIPIKELYSVSGRVFSLDKNLKVHSAKWDQFFKRTVNELWHITFRSGRKLSLTPEHPLLTIRGWKTVDELDIGSRVATPRIIEAFGNQSLPECNIKLLAYMLAEGHVKTHLFFTNSDPDIVMDFKRAVSDFQPELCVTRIGEMEYKINSKFEKRRFLECDFGHNGKGQFTAGGSVRFEKRRIRTFFEKHKLYGKLSLEKFIPEAIFKLPKHQLALFLNRIFSCDGSIYYSNGWEISYASASEQFAHQVQHLILRYGVLSVLREKYCRINTKIFKAYEVVVNSENVDRFIQSIGFFGKKAIKQIHALRENELIKRNPNVDTIPREIWDIYRPKSWVAAGEALGYDSPKAARSSIGYAPTRQKLLTIAISDENKTLQKLAESDIFWDEITFIETEFGNFEVFDISIPEMHNFVANDIIVHNSYTLGVIAEGIANLEPEVRNRLSVLMLDTMGIYWTMKYPNNQDTDLLKEWHLEGKGLPIVIFCPKGLFSDYKAKGIPADVQFSIKPSELGPDDWNSTFELTTNDPIAVFIERIILELKKERDSYSIKEIIEALNTDKTERDEVINAAVNRFKAADSWGIFAEESTPMKELAFPGRIAVLDLSAYMTMPNGWKIKHLVMGLVCKSLFQERMLVRKSEEFESVHSALHFIKVSEDEEKLRGKEMPVVWIMVDECVPGNAEIITNTAHTPMLEVIRRVKQGEPIKVWGYDTKRNEFGYFDVIKTYEKGERDVIKITTETGRAIVCTPNHRVLSSNNFIHALFAKDIAVPLEAHYCQKIDYIKARVLGHLLGDGWLSEKMLSGGCSGKGNLADLEKIKKDLAALGFCSSAIHTRTTHSSIKPTNGQEVKVNGISQSIHFSHKAYRFFKSLGAVLGEKAVTKYSLPSWLMQASQEVKAEFLAALFGSDGTAPTQTRKVSCDFNPVRLTFNKIEELWPNAHFFANQIIQIMRDLGINAAITEREGNIRKDGKFTKKMVITLSKKTSNMIAFLDKVGYRYCARKEAEGTKWRSYLRMRQYEKSKRESLRERSLELHKQGLGKTRIARQLNIPVHHVREWIYSGGQAWLPKGLPGFKTWCSERVVGNLLFERINLKEPAGKKIVYDIAVDCARNFVSNGVVMHNCHEFLPRDEKTSATDALVTLLREGRQPGIALVLATQQPGKIHTDAMTQSDIILSHRLTAKIDTDALAGLMQSYLRKGLDVQLDILPKVPGACIAVDDVAERMYPLRIRPRFSWHGGSAPDILKKEVKKEKNNFGF